MQAPSGMDHVAALFAGSVAGASEPAPRRDSLPAGSVALPPVSGARRNTATASPDMLDLS